MYCFRTYLEQGPGSEVAESVTARTGLQLTVQLLLNSHRMGSPSHTLLAHQSLGQQIVLESPDSSGGPELGPRVWWKDGAHPPGLTFVYRGPSPHMGTFWDSPLGRAVSAGGLGKAGADLAFPPSGSTFKV